MVTNLVLVQLPDKQIFFREPSFYEYKNICKMLISDDIACISNCFNTVLKDLVVCEQPLNVVDKFKCLIAIRNTIHGNEIAFENNGKRINHDLSLVLDRSFDDSQFVIGDLTFGSPADFFTSSYDELIGQCLVKVGDQDVTDLKISHKIALMNEMTLPITSIYRQILERFGTRSIEIYKDLDICIYNSEYVLTFLKNIYLENLLSIFNFEYMCMRSLDIKSADFNMYTYPELKIFINYLNKEKDDQNKATHSN